MSMLVIDAESRLADIDGMGRDRHAHVYDQAEPGPPWTALCGKKLKGRSPDNLPVCPTCREVCKANGWRMP